MRSAIWQGLMRGEWVVVDRFDDSAALMAARIPPPARLDVFEIGVAGMSMVLLTFDVPAEATLPTLTDAESAVLKALLKGMTNAQIGALRRTSPRTVANQVASLFRKLSVGSRAELAARYAALHMLSGTPGAAVPRARD